MTDEWAADPEDWNSPECHSPDHARAWEDAILGVIKEAFERLDPMPSGFVERMQIGVHLQMLLDELGLGDA